MEKAEVVRWLAAYVEAWKSYERDQILALFADDVHYRYYPHEEPIVGAPAVADSWLDEPDEPGSFEAAYEPVAVDGDTAVATGLSTYTNADGSIKEIYENCFVIRFDEHGRCAEFVEYYVKRPEGSDA